MIYIRLRGHEYNYDVLELIKLFFFNEDIQFCDDETLVNYQGLLIESILVEEEDKISVKSKIFKNDSCISSSHIDDADSIDIKEDNLKKKIKIAIKQSIFKALTTVTDVKAPWGILTGIRPTKIVHELYDKGYDRITVYSVLTKEYYLSSEKANLIIEIADKERKFLYPLDEDRFSLYIGIPFCPTRCLYCSFPSNSLVKWGSFVEEYTSKLIYEIQEVSKFLRSKKLNTVYIGGGTPTAIPVANLDRIIKSLYKAFDTNEFLELTVEAGRPDTINEEMLNMLKENRVHRLSINPQTMNKKTLSLIGRDHSPEDIIRSFDMAKNIGFDSINMDIIVGLPEESSDDVRTTMEEIIKLEPDNLTVHTMAVKRASKLKESIDEYSLSQQKAIEEMLETTRLYASKMDLSPYYMYRQKQILGNYENVGYAKEGKECIYNMAIMEEKETIIALGAGGVSKFFYPKENRLERVPNVKNLPSYIDRIDEMIERKVKFLKTC